MAIVLYVYLYDGASPNTKVKVNMASLRNRLSSCLKLVRAKKNLVILVVELYKGPT